MLGLSEAKWQDGEERQDQEEQQQQYPTNELQTKYAF
jgi:hypothetical protein